MATASQISIIRAENWFKQSFDTEKAMISVDEEQLLTWFYASSLLSAVNSSPLDKMASILADDIFKSIFLNENDTIPIKNSLIFVAQGPIDNKRALV